MSSAAVLRLKEHGGSGCGIPAAKTAKTVTPSATKVLGDGIKRSSGKENPRSTSRVRGASLKPATRPMPRIEKQSAVAVGFVEVGNRRPSSVPRGRSSSPLMRSSKVVPDLGKNRDSRVSGHRVEKVGDGDAGSGGRGIRGFRSSERVYRSRSGRGSSLGANERFEAETRVFGDGKREEKNGEFNVKLSRKENDSDDESQLKVESLSCFREQGDAETDKPVAKSHSNASNLSSGRMVDKRRDKSDGVLRHGVAVSKARDATSLSAKDVGKKASSEMKVSSAFKDKEVREEGTNSHATIKYPSKLHEKLAFLESKVKRIASDIKWTKEMLDSNKSAESKVILSDIQEKISGIEKAMGRVASDSSGKPFTGKIGNPQNKRTEMSNPKQGDMVIMKVLNREELEARLFPHDRLLRDRMLIKSSSESSKSYCQISESKEAIHADINLPPFEPLASHNQENSKSKVIMDENIKVELCPVQEMDGVGTSKAQGSVDVSGKHNPDVILTTTETLDELDTQENTQTMVSDDFEDTCMYQLNEIGRRTSTGGWFVSEGESVLLAHDDASCSLYDVTNCEEKALYKPPAGVSTNVWGDCWIVRAPGADGCSGRYIVAASAGNALDSGFCSWDYYTKDVQAFHLDNEVTTTRTVLGPLPNNTSSQRSLSTISQPSENVQWWYKPCGPLIVATACSKQVVKIYDIRDGEQIMDWEVPKPVSPMENSSPVQWRNREKLVLAEAGNICVWDVSSQKSQPLLYISSSGRKISALHVVNTDAELGGGVRQRVTSSEAEGNDGVFCTSDFINILDFRHPTGIGLKIPQTGLNSHSVFSRGDSVFLGCSNGRKSAGRKQFSQIQHFSLRKQKLVTSYVLPESNAHPHYTAMTQVWGNSNLVMGICGLGLYVFDALNGDAPQSSAPDNVSIQKVREVIGPNDMYAPSFDYLSSRALIISRDRPAMWQLVL
uniref:At4g14310 8-bladed propeller domain-containing protein n=1 Tax=Kalanchoe fedtschenkoi TaxID=63787 RepID=A0A7N0UUT6_KALFE